MERTLSAVANPNELIVSFIHFSSVGFAALATFFFVARDISCRCIRIRDGTYVICKQIRFPLQQKAARSEGARLRLIFGAIGLTKGKSLFECL
jgi:hypothetical protein